MFKLLIRLGLSLVLIAGVIIGLAFYASMRVDHAVHNAFAAIGSPLSDNTLIQKRFGAIRYSDVTLGDDDQGAIDMLIIQYDPLNARNIRSIIADGIFLSGDMDVQQRVTIAGVHSLAPLVNAVGDDIKSITLRNINISILSADLGGLRGVINLSANREDAHLRWTGNIDTRQDQLELVAKFSGQTRDDGHWFVDFDIENAKLERGFGKVTRANGTLSVENGSPAPIIKANINAGAMALHKTSWQGVNISAQGALNALPVFINARSAGVDGLEINIEGTIKRRANQATQSTWRSNIYSENWGNVIAYLTAHGMATPTDNDFSALDDARDIDIAVIKHGAIFNYRVSNADKSVVFNGKYATKP